MTRRAVRTARIAGAITMLVGSALAGWIEPAAATGLGGTAWWWRPQQDPPVLKAPNVPDGGFMVQGAPDDPTTTFPDGASAIAAIRFTLDKGQANPVLTLKLVKEQSQAGPNPIIYACQAGSAWGAASGPQAWAAHPKPDCTKSVQGQIAADGSAIVFPAGPLQFNDQLDVILVPGIDPALPAPANSSVFTFVFEPPTQAALVTSAGTPPPPPPPPASFTAPTGAPATGEGSFTAPAATSFTPPVAALPPSQQGQTATAPVVNAATTPSIPVRSADNNDDNNSQLIGLLVLLAGAGIAFWSYRSSQAGASGPRTADGEHIGGLGRFARPREGIAPRLG